jgi:hypothetical protein
MRSKAYLFIVLIVIFAFLLSLNRFRLFTLDELSLLLTVIGLIYGLIVAFTIGNAWERFSGIRDAIAEETYALTSMYFYSKQLSDKESTKLIKSRIINYCKEVPTIEWHEYWNSEKTHKKFRDILETISKIKFKVEKDSNLFDEITTDMEDAARSRNKQLVLAQSRISKLQWVLNIFLSAVLVAGLTLVSIPNPALSVFITVLIIVSVLLILVVLYELDSMRMAEEEVSNQPYYKVVEIIEADKA